MRHFFWLLGSIIIVFTGHPALAQEEVAVDCSREAIVYSKAYMEHFNRNEYELAEDVLYQWEQECGITEPIKRARILLWIQNDRFTLQAEPPALLEAAVEYSSRQDLLNIEHPEDRDLYYEDNMHYYGYIPPDREFDRFTHKVAEQLFAEQGQNDLAVSFLHLYAGTSKDFFTNLKHGSFTGSKLSEDYHYEVRKLKRIPEFNLGMGIGLWIPNGDLVTLGIKPVANLYAGLKFHNFTLNAIADIRFGKSKDPFEIAVLDTLVQTRNHQGGYFGLQLKQILVKKSSLHFGVIASAGIDIIDIVGDQQFAGRQTFTSAGFQAGVFAEYIFANRSRLTLIPGYQFISHHNYYGTAMNGNAYLLRLTYGLTENARRNQRLARLGH